MTRLALVLAMVIVIVAAGCNASFAPPPPPTTTTIPATATPTSPPLTTAGAAPGLCTRWITSALDLSALPPVTATQQLLAENDGRGGVTLAAWRADGSVIARALAPDGSWSGTTVIDPPAMGATPRQVIAAPNDAWVAVWDDADGVSVVAYDASGSHVVDAGDASYDEGSALRVGVSEDGYVGVADLGGVRWWPLDGGSEQIAFATGLPIELGGRGSERWLDGELVFASASPSPEIGAIERDASYTLAPAPAVLVGSTLPVVGARARAAAFLSEVPTSPSVPSGTPIGITLLADGHVHEARLDVPVDIWGGVVARTASEGVLILWSDRGVTGAGGAAANLVEIAPDGTRGDVLTLGHAPVAPTDVVTASTADGDAIVFVEWNGSVRSSWLARCDRSSP